MASGLRAIPIQSDAELTSGSYVAASASVVPVRTHWCIEAYNWMYLCKEGSLWRQNSEFSVQKGIPLYESMALFQQFFTKPLILLNKLFSQKTYIL